MDTTSTAQMRFDALTPACQRAVTQALWRCQLADQEDALQVGLLEVWRKLNTPATAANTDSWFIWRAVAYARSYAQRMVYRYQQRAIALVSDDQAAGMEDFPSRLLAAPDEMASALDRVDVALLIGRLDNPTDRSIVVGLLAGQPKQEIARSLSLSYGAMRNRCERIARLVAA
jgi:DNA-directed RNA polymerase specialized sigma24 family protein